MKTRIEGLPTYQEVRGLLITIVIVLLFVGVVMVFSSSAIYAYDKFGNSFYFLRKQIFWILLGSLGLIFFKNFNYEKFKDIARPLFLISIVILCLVFVPHIGKAGGGARRWIQIFGFNFEPSEFVKLAFIIYIAEAIFRKHEYMKSFIKGFLPYLVIMGIIFGILIIQPDLGSIFLIGILGIIMLFVGGVKLGHIFLFFLSSLPVAFIMIVSAGYRLKRIMAFLDPWKDPRGVGFQIVQSFIAFGSGGFMGKGLGQGTQKLFYLPEAHTDFIFAIIAEELGLIGVTCILILFGLIIWKGINLALNTNEVFGKLLATGITSYIGLQAFMNMSVVTGLLPTKGMTLPFISYGGSSLIMNMIAIGILLNISKIKNEKSYY
ncbi:MAG: putative lipid II flippase FtsW [Candidatus Firestonebacteria bacterium]